MSYNSNTNHLSTVGSQNVLYDAAGNLLNTGSATGTYDYTWDAEGRMTSVGSPGPAGNTIATYVYNALGQRVKRSGTGVTGSPLYETYDAFGNLAMVTSNSTLVEDLIGPVAGRVFAKYTPNGTFFLHADALGSSFYATDWTGQNWVQSALYDPWGQQWVMWGTSYGTIDDRYAGMRQRDPESWLDPTPFRMYASLYGRWLSPDPVAGDITNPQSLNRYAYGLNRPSSLNDARGLSPNPPACLGQRRQFSQPTTGCGYGPVEGGGGVSIDGGPLLPWGLFGEGSLAGGESAYLCPPGGCYQPGLDPLTGQVTMLEFWAGAGGATGFLSTYDIQQGVNEVNGAFLSDVAFQAYLQGNFLDAINAQLAAVINALEDRGVNESDIKTFENFVSENFSGTDIEGGNANFSSYGTTSNGQSFDFGNFGCPEERCDQGALGTLDFSHNNAMFHLDTADPYSGVWGALAHFGVDLILGNTAYWVLPR
jgi:RHS repeat-associated protein